ncbi:MAG: sodium:proton antiporter [Planctomycetes bacterium]|nr:sodium:proton antiporter [Planctomycetota bacterium]
MTSFSEGSSHDSALHVVTLVALVIGLGIAVQWIASRARLPALILLLACGFTLGPVLGVLDPDAMLGELLQPVISVAVAIVLFEGGLTLRVEEARRAGPVLGRLIASGLVVGFAAVTALGAAIAGLSLPTAAVLGAILVVTGPTVILPMLRQARISMRPATLLKWEGIVNDPLGALLAVVVFQIAVADATASGGTLEVLGGLLLRAAGAGAIGAVAGILLGRALGADLFTETLRSPAMLAAVLLVYAAGENLGPENGLLAVTVFGVVLANTGDASIEDIQHFKEQISVLLVSVLFIVLSARISLDDMGALLGAPAILVAAVIFVVRPLVVAVATWRSKLPRGERLLVGWIAPRGVVAAAVASAFELQLVAAGHDDARLLVPIVFGVIVATVLLHGLTITAMAHRLDLGARPGTGILIVGASNWTLALADALTRAGAFVVLADARYHRVSRARREGFVSYYGDVLSEEAGYELPLERLSWVLAATDDDSYNALVCLDFARDLGRSAVLQLTPEGGERGKEGEHRTVGRTPWGDGGTYRALASAYWLREQFKVTRLTEQFTHDELRQRNPAAVLLFKVVDERIAPIDAESPPAAGAHVVYLEETPHSRALETGQPG